MRNIRLLIPAMVLAATFALAASSQASTEFWLTQIAGSKIINGSMINVNPGQDINMSVYFNTTEYAGAVNIMLGYATATAWGDSVSGTGVKLTSQYPETDWALGSSKWPTYNFDPAFTTMYPSLGGAYHPTAGVTPWGLNQAGFFADDNPRSDTRLFDFMFGSSLAAGESVVLTIWDASAPPVSYSGTQNTWTSCIYDTDMNIYRPGTNYSITLTAVPEPSTALALASGLMGLAGMTLRRRR